MFNKLFRYGILGIFFFLSTISFATPREIIVVRHADKLDQSDTGPALDPTGYFRAIKLAFYILKNYGSPDFLVATNPNKKADEVSSIRELQTLAPLANELEKNYPQVKYKILDPYTVPEHAELAQYLLHNARFQNKLVVVSWDHHTIPALVKELGVSQKLPVWNRANFDSVYVLKYNAKGELASEQFLTNQYPVAPILSWNDLLEKVESSS